RRPRGARPRPIRSRHPPALAGAVGRPGDSKGSRPGTLPRPEADHPRPMSDLSLSPAALAAGCCGAGAAALDMTGPVQRGSADRRIADPAAFLRREADGLCHLDLMAENIHCADCIRKIEGRLRAMPGVAAARVNLGLRRIAVAWREGEVEPVALVEAVTRLGYPAAPFDPGL